jgi:hypothetical protein
MLKTIKAISKTNIPEHPAVGAIYHLTFVDGTTDLVYEETFYHQFVDFPTVTAQHLVGRDINTEYAYFDLN